MMKGNEFADNEHIVCRVNCWQEDQHQKLFYNKNLTPDQVHFSSKNTLKVAKYNAYLFCITMSVYKLFECPSYFADIASMILSY